MVKWKAVIDLDEWLRLVPATLRVETASTVPMASEVVPNQASTTKISSVGKGTGVVVNPPADVANNQDDTSEWFWLLLEQSGYERWWLVLQVQERVVTGAVGSSGRG